MKGSYDVRDPLYVVLFSVLSVLLVFIFSSILSRVKYRPWLLPWWLSRQTRLISTLLPLAHQKESLWWFHRCIQSLSFSILFLLPLSLVLTASLTVYFSYTVSKWGMFVQRSVSLVFLAAYLLCLFFIVSLWSQNQWTLSPLLTFSSYFSSNRSRSNLGDRLGKRLYCCFRPDSSSRTEAKEDSDQEESRGVQVDEDVEPTHDGEGTGKERLLAIVLIGLMTLSVVFYTLANAFLVPFGDCNAGTDYCTIENVTGLSSDEKHDVEWPIAANWLFLLVNSIAMIAAVFFADLYIHAGADLLVETHAKVAENLMRYGVSSVALVSCDRDLSLAQQQHPYRRSSLENNQENAPSSVSSTEKKQTLKDVPEQSDEADEEESSDEGFEPLADGFYGTMHSDGTTMFASDSPELKQRTLQREMSRASRFLTNTIWKRVSQAQDILRLGERPESERTSSLVVDAASDGNNNMSYPHVEDGYFVSNAAGTKKKSVGLNRISSMVEEQEQGEHGQQNGFVKINRNYLHDVVKEYQRVMRFGFLATYSFSVVVLLVHASVHMILMDKTYFFFQVIGILLTDMMLLVKFSSSTYRKSRVQAGHNYAHIGGIEACHLSAILLAVRVVLEGVPSHTWFLGQAAMYAITGMYLMCMMLSDYLGKNAEWFYKDQRSVWEKWSRISSASDLLRWCKPFLATFSRELTFLIFTIYISTLTWVLSKPAYTAKLQFATRTDDYGLISIKLLDDEVPQWKFGVLAILLVLIFVVYTIAVMQYRAFKLHHLKLSNAARGSRSTPYVPDRLSRSSTDLSEELEDAGAGSELPGGKLSKTHGKGQPTSYCQIGKLLLRVTLASLALFAVPVFTAWFISRDMFGQTTDLSFISAVATLLPAFICGLGVHHVWVHDDYNFWLSVNRKTCPSKTERSYRWRRNLAMIAGVCFVVLCVALFGFTLHIELGPVNALPHTYKILFPLSIFSLVCGVLAAELWFNTLEASPALVCLTVLHVVSLFFACAYGMKETRRNRKVAYDTITDAFAILFLTLPLFNMGAVSMLAFVDNNFRTSPLVIVTGLGTIAATLAVAVWVSVRFGLFPGVMFYVFSFLVFSAASIWMWMRSRKGMDKRPVKVLFMGVGLIVAIFIALGLWDAFTTRSRLFGEFSDPLNGLSYFLVAAVIALMFAIVWIFGQERDLQLNATCESPASSFLGVPVIAYKVEHKGGELLLQNGNVYRVLGIMLCIQLVSYVVAHVKNPNVGVLIGSVAMCAMEIFALHMALARCMKFRQELLGLEELHGLDHVFREIVKESVERCLQISQQAMMLSWLSGAKEKQPDHQQKHADQMDLEAAAGMNENEGDFVVIDSVPGLKAYYKQVYAADRMVQMYYHDSLKYQALFHVLFLMRIKQLREFQKARRMNETTKAAALARDLGQRETPPASNTTVVNVSIKSPPPQQENENSNAQSLWTDTNFSPDNSSLYQGWDTEDEDLQELEEDALWVRPAQLVPPFITPAVVSHGKDLFFDPTEIIQGEVGDCWLLSAMSVVALYPHLLDRVMVTKQISPNGIYLVRLFLDGEWKDVYVDDHIPCAKDRSLSWDATAHSWCTISQGPDRNQGRFPLPLYCKSRSGGILWPLLIEKAFAKRFGSYEALTGGHVDEALVDLTGGMAQKFSLKEDIELVMSGALWSKLVDSDRKGLLLAASSPTNSQEARLEDYALSVDGNGIVHGHAYSIVRVEEQVDRNGSHKLLQLRDPWGVCQWKGRWCHTDRDRWTRRMKNRVNYTTSSANDNDDGTFWICFEDFIASFKYLHVCRLFDPSQFFQKTVHGTWDAATPSSSQQFAFCIRNSSGRSKVGSPVKVFVSIRNATRWSADSHADVEGDEDDDNGYPFVCLLLLDLGGKRVQETVLIKSIVASTGKHKNSRELSFETKLPCDDRTVYTLFPSAFPPSAGGSFAINVHCDTDFDLNPL